METFENNLSEIFGPILLLNLAHNFLGWKGFKVVQSKANALFQVDIYSLNYMYIVDFVSLSLNNLENLSQTWQKLSIWEENSNLYKPWTNQIELFISSLF